MAMGDARRQDRVRSNGWTSERKRRFLIALEESGQIKLAAMAAGRADTSSAYKLRERDPAFAAAWDAAIERAKTRIEGALLARALAAIETQAAKSGSAAIEPLDFNQMMQLLNYYRAGPLHGQKRGPKRRYASPEETDAALHAALDAVAVRVRARKKREAAARKAARAAGGQEVVARGSR
jgi:hypothetical protein